MVVKFFAFALYIVVLYALLKEFTIEQVLLFVAFTVLSIFLGGKSNE